MNDAHVQKEFCEYKPCMPQNIGHGTQTASLTSMSALIWKIWLVMPFTAHAQNGCAMQLFVRCLALDIDPTYQVGSQSDQKFQRNSHNPKLRWPQVSDLTWRVTGLPTTSKVDISALELSHVTRCSLFQRAISIRSRTTLCSWLYRLGAYLRRRT